MSTNEESEGAPQNPLDLVLAQRVAVDDLPGTFRKWASIGPSESGLLVDGSQVVRTMPEGRHTVAWKFMGLGSSGRSVIWLHSGAFTTRLHFRGLLSSDLLNIDALVSTTVRVGNPELFHRMVIGNSGRLEISQVSSIISAALDDALQFKVSEYTRESLSGDEAVRSEVAAAVDGDIRKVLGERGLTLEEVNFVRFRTEEEEEETRTQVERLTDINRPDPDAIRSVESVLLERGLITEEELQRIGTTGGLRAVQEKMAQRMESEDVSQGESLAKKLEAVDGAEPEVEVPRSRPNLSRFTPIIGATVVLSSFLVWVIAASLPVGAIIGGIAGFGSAMWGMITELRGFILSRIIMLGWGQAKERLADGGGDGASEGAQATAGQAAKPAEGLNFSIFFLAMTVAPGFFIGAIVYNQGPHLAGIIVGVAVGLLGAAGAIYWEVSRRKKKLSLSVEIGRPELDKWIQRNTLRTDDLVRRQVGRDLARAFDDITNVRMELYRQGVRDIIDDLRRMEQEVDNFRTEISSAAVGRRNLGDNSRASRGRIKRLMNFEEDMSRRARVFGHRIQKMRESGAQDREALEREFQISRQLLDSLKRIFTERTNILEGFVVQIS